MRGKKRPSQIIENVTITGLADKGKCAGRTPDGMVVFVDGVAPGDVVDVKTSKKKAGYFEGQAVVFHEYSKERTSPFCSHYGVCGGCKWQHIQYEAQLKHKQIVVENALKHLGKVDVGAFLPIIGGVETQYYRNKLEFTFSNKIWLTQEEMADGATNLKDVSGFHRPGSFDKVVEITQCYLQADPSNELRNVITALGIEQGLSFFDVYKKTGFLRQLFIRLSSVGELMLILSFGEDSEKKRKKFLDAILQKFPQITTLHYCINSKVNDFILDLDIHTYFGKGYIEDKLGDVRFKIGPKSFFQTNTKQAVKLFDVVSEFAEFQGNENVYDLYTGLGSIALYVADKCKQVVGIEEIEAAIVDAKENASFNNINNAVFYAGDVKNILTEEFAQKHGKPDILITDPPRVGMHPAVVEMLLKLATPKIVYVSCNPATQARDLQMMSEKYEVVKSQPVDMFPHTHHIENVVLLKLKNGFDL